MEKNTQLEEAVAANLDYIMSETLTKTLVFEDGFQKGIEIEFDEIKTIILISK